MNIVANDLCILAVITTLALFSASCSRQEPPAIDVQEVYSASEVPLPDPEESDSILDPHEPHELDAIFVESTTPVDESTAFDLTTTDGVLYRECVISDYSLHGITITHASGVTDLLWSDLPAALSNSKHFCTEAAWTRILDRQRRQQARADAQARIAELSAQMRPTFRSESDRCSSCNGRGYREGRFASHDGSRTRFNCSRCSGSGVETKQVAVYDNAHDIESIQRQIEGIDRNLQSQLASGPNTAIVVDDDYWRFRLMVLSSMRTAEFTPAPIGQPITVTTTDGLSVNGVLSRIEPNFVIIEGVMYGRPSLCTEDRLKLFALDWAASQLHSQVAEERRLHNAISTAMTRARQSAAAEQISGFEEALATLDDAIAQFPQALNISQAIAQATRYREHLAEHEEMTARGYVRHHRQWVTPAEKARLQEQERRLELARRQQSREEQARRQAAITSAACRGCYRNFQAAQSAARARTQHNQGGLDALRQANIGVGGAIEGAAHQLHRYKVVSCRNCNGYRIVLE